MERRSNVSPSGSQGRTFRSLTHDDVNFEVKVVRKSILDITFPELPKIADQPGPAFGNMLSDHLTRTRTPPAVSTCVHASAPELCACAPFATTHIAGIIRPDYAVRPESFVHTCLNNRPRDHLSQSSPANSGMAVVVNSNTSSKFVTSTAD